MHAVELSMKKTLKVELFFKKKKVKKIEIAA